MNIPFRFPILITAIFILSFSLVSAFGFQNADIVGDTGSSRHVEIEDLDGDGYLDIYVAQRSNEQNKIWINNGDGTFTNNDISAANGTILGGNNTGNDQGVSYGGLFGRF